MRSRCLDTANTGASTSRFPWRTMLLIGALALTSPSHGGDGHDHGDEAPPAAGGNGPRRQPDGSVFLPKPAQRQIGVRTAAVIHAELSRTIELAGKVSMDPNAGGRVQPIQAGRIEAGPHGLPSVGQDVKKGEVLAYVVPSVGSVERSNQAAQLAELRSAKVLAEKRLARLQDLVDTVPRKDIEVAEAEVDSLAQRLAAIGNGLTGREALIAPVSGVITSASVVSGQVVDARELVFEIVDPSKLRIEALAYDLQVATDVGGASLSLDNARVPLKFIGAARSLREQALVLSFQAEGPALARLAVGQPLRVFVQTTSTKPGMRVPSQALVKNPSNQSVVWVKAAPERFEPRVVTFESLDGVSVAVTAGLAPGERVAVQGANLINQIR